MNTYFTRSSTYSVNLSISNYAAKMSNKKKGKEKSRSMSYTTFYRLIRGLPLLYTKYLFASLFSSSQSKVCALSLTLLLILCTDFFFFLPRHPTRYYLLLVNIEYRFGFFLSDFTFFLFFCSLTTESVL